MRRFLNCLLLALCATSAFTQKAILPKPKSDLVWLGPRTAPPATTTPPRPPANPAKVAFLNPPQLGSASNVWTIVNSNQNQVSAVDSLGMVAFIHRNDINVYGGSSGYLRYDLSTDAGTSWSKDIGILNPVQTWPARYPQLSIYHEKTGAGPFATRMAFYAPLFNTANSQWDGHLAGLGNTVTSGSCAGTETYQFLGDGTWVSGGLCQSIPGVFWVAEQHTDGFNPLGDLYIYRGEYQSSLDDIYWERTDTILVNNFIDLMGGPAQWKPNMAFSPDGEVGWLGWLGDLVGGTDSVYLPCLSRSLDCGATWEEPVEVNLNAFAWIHDSLQTLWVDSTGSPISDGRAGCAYDWDLTVDANGNPHFVVVLATAEEYGIYPELSKFIVDITSTDRGLTWQAEYISPVLTFRSQIFGNQPQVIWMDNHVQVARDEGGCNVFYAWVDSDTATVTGNQNGLGFGEYNNFAPNLRVAAKNVTTGLRTYPQLVSDLDLIWDGAILFPTMAPIVLSNPGGGWRLPTVSVTMTAQDPLNQANFWYLGNDVVVPETGWCTPASMNLSWDHFAYQGFQSTCSGASAPCNTVPASPCIPVGIEAQPSLLTQLLPPAPNPCDATTMVRWTQATEACSRVLLRDLQGRIVATEHISACESGQHTFDLPTRSLPSGIYLLSLEQGESAYHQKLVVTH